MVARSPDHFPLENDAKCVFWRGRTQNAYSAYGEQSNFKENGAVELENDG